jgi:hypothetical protein
MTVLDRLNRHRMQQDTRALTAGESETGLSSIPVVERSPVVLRLQAVMTTLNSFVIKNDETGMARFAFLLQALTDEVIEELTEKDEETIGVFMSQMGEVIAWIGHGDTERLPENMREFALSIQPESVDA